MNHCQFLVGATVLPSLSFSGCVSTVLSADHPILNCLELSNRHDEPHTVHLRVHFDGDEVVSDSYELAARQEAEPISNEWVTQTWADQPGRFRIQARLDNETEWKTFDSEGRSGDLAYAVMYRIDSDGYGAFWKNAANADTRERQCEHAPTAAENTSAS